MQRTFALLTLATVALLPLAASAQNPKVTTPPAAPLPQPHQAEREISIGDIPPTQELYIYQQELKRAQDPKQAIRRRAEFRAAQRERRIASQEWYGISPMRPNANTTPFTGGLYSPGWAGNSRETFRWMPQTPMIVIPGQNFNGIYGLR